MSGNCRISVSLVIEDQNVASTVINMSADSPLSELTERLTSSILSKFEKIKFKSDHGQVLPESSTETLCVYDCTLHPPIDISPKLVQYDQPTGPHSITLQTMNWFPSAKLAIFRANDDQARERALQSDIHVHEDFQYNLPSNSNKVQLKSSASTGPTLIGHATAATTPLPSQVYQAVQNRFQGSEMDPSLSSSGPTYNAKSITRRRIEDERKAQIDARLKKLDENKKQSKVSIQVKKMLIKSRAEGDKKIRIEDRFFLETVVMDEAINSKSGDSNSSRTARGTGELSSTHRFYGRSSNVGKIISSATRGLNIASDRMAELLVLTIDEQGEDSTYVYKRLPSTMPIHEAERSGYLTSFDRVIVRIFPISNGTDSVDYSTPLVGSPSTVLSSSSDTDEPFEEIPGDLAQRSGPNSVSGVNERTFSDKEKIVLGKINIAIKELDDKDSKGRKKKKTAATEKVRQILLKGKSKGEKKIPEKDRFYFEVITFTADFHATSCPGFVSKYDLVKVVTKKFSLETNVDSDNKYSLLVKCNESGLYSQILPKEIRLIDAENQGLLKPYQRIAVSKLSD